MTWGEHPDKSYPTTLKDCFALAGKTRKGGGDNDRHGIIVLYLEGMPLEGGAAGQKGDFHDLCCCRSGSTVGTAVQIHSPAVFGMKSTHFWML